MASNGLLLILAAMATTAVASNRPMYEWDPATVKSCVEWYNNDASHTCEYVRDYFTITPAQFHQWNPSIGLDCTPWRQYVSYCIVTQERLDDANKSKTTSSSTATIALSTTTSTPLGPSPTAWVSLGCYTDSTDKPILEKRMNSRAGDKALTIGKCENTCYRAGFTFAGVENGVQCWCSSYIGGEFAKKPAECNVPCSGDSKATCGGKERLNIFAIPDGDDDDTLPVTTRNLATTTHKPTASSIASSKAVANISSKSGSTKNKPFN